MSTLRQWIKNARPTALPQSIFPCVLAVCLATASGGFTWWLAVLAFLGVVCAHLGFNLFDDYFDYRKKKSTYREELVHEGFRARIGKCTYLTSGEATLKELFLVASAFCAVALVLGAVVFYFRGMAIVYIVIITGFLGLEYSAPPLRLSYHGMGELLIGIIFGVLNMMGTYYASCGELNWTVFLISVAVGLLVTNVVYVHSILDLAPDKKIGKHTLAVLLNNNTANLTVLFFVVFMPFAIIAGLILKGYLSPLYWVVMIILPIAVSLYYLMVEFIRNPDRVFEPRFYMGPMNGWKRIQAAGIEWFMIRWLSARNLLSFFCLILMIISLIH